MVVFMLKIGRKKRRPKSTVRIRDELYQPIGDMQAECDILHILSSAILEVIL